MKKKIKADKFFDNKKEILHYKKIYSNKIDFSKDYPANQKRLEIVIKKLNQIRPKTILDAGCGNALPLIKIKKKKFNIIGYDKSRNMVYEAKQNLEQNNLNKDLVFYGDFKNKKFSKKFDCIIGLGSFYYTDNFDKVILNQTRALKKGGYLIFSLRNELFNSFTMNEYTVTFLSNLFSIKKFNKKAQNAFFNFFKGFKFKNKNFSKNIDQNNVESLVHNPLKIKDEFLKKFKLDLIDIDYYHYHCLPPPLENLLGDNFREISWKMENSADWRGIFLASAFVVTCKKIA